MSEIIAIGDAASDQGTRTANSASDKLYLENTLLRVAGALFRHDAKRAAITTEEIVVRGGNAEKTITIRPDARVGQPGPLAHKLFIALLKKHSDYGLPVKGQVSFTKREIMGMIGRKSWGGRDSEQLTRALHEIHYSFVKAHFRDASGKWIEHSFNVFPEIWIERREFASDPIEACTVTLAAPIIASLRDEHFTCLNHALMSGLGTIGQALYLRLFFHFANLYDGRNRKALVFPKRYDAICAEWLGGLRVLAHPSKIIGEQLGMHIDQLIDAGFLARYALTKARSGDGFVLTFYPGDAFFDDYDRFYRKGRQGTVRVASDASAEDSGGNALKVAYLFAQKRTGQPIAYVSSKDKETAKQFLQQLSIEGIPPFLDFALEEARRTNFDVQTLGGIRPYLASYLATRERLAANAGRQQAHRQRQQAEAQKEMEEAQRLVAAKRRFDVLSQSEQHIVRQEAEIRARKFPDGPLRAMMVEHHIACVMVERVDSGAAAASDQEIGLQAS